MIVNHFGMRQDIQAYSLGGMGCGTGVIGINLVADLLKVGGSGENMFASLRVVTEKYVDLYSEKAVAGRVHEQLPCLSHACLKNWLQISFTQARPNCIALFVPSEITSYCFYNGEEANRMISNVIFRWVEPST